MKIPALRRTNGGYLSTLQWARENGCPWDKNTCVHTACGGHMSTLQWALENKSKCPANICDWAGLHGRLQVLQWLKDKGTYFMRAHVVRPLKVVIQMFCSG